MRQSEYLEGKIQRILSEMVSVFSDLEFKSEVLGNINYENDDLHQDVLSIEDQFKSLANDLRILILAYFQKKKQPLLLKLFDESIIKVYFDNNKLLDSEYDELSGHTFSKLVGEIWRLLQPFPAFDSASRNELLKRTGLHYLQAILESTAVILADLKITPKSEHEVYSAVKIVCKSAFPSASFPSEAIVKIAKQYKPDILLPSLNCAIEYKYATDEKRLISIIDEILIDVKGYENHSVYKLFYAVFYVTPGIWTRSRFEEVWKEKDFPNYWKAIYVEGN